MRRLGAQYSVLNRARTEARKDTIMRENRPNPVIHLRGRIAAVLAVSLALLMAAIDDETIMLYPCIVKGGEVTFLSFSQRSEGISGFSTPYVDAMDGLFYSMATYSDPDADPRDPNTVRSPAVVGYADHEFKLITDVWLLAPYDEDRFRSPQRVDVHPNGTVYVTERSRVYCYSPEGQRQNTLPRNTYPTDPISVTLQFATGDGTPDGVIGLGTCHNGANDLPCVCP